MNYTTILKAYSYGNSNIPSDVFDLQKQVFEKLKLPVEQIICDLSHGDFLTETAKNCDSKYIVFFDADCIPLTSDIYDIILHELKEECIIGIEQMCGCNPHNHLYAGPACLAFSTDLFKKLGCPSLCQNGNKSDVGEELTWRCEENNIKVKFFRVQSVEIPLWRLPDERLFGIGTTYSFNDKVLLYHQFEIRKSTENFKKRCRDFLNL